jgi:hypothetical protein
MEERRVFSRRIPLWMALLVVMLCTLAGEILPRWFLWVGTASLLCFAASWFSYRSGAGGFGGRRSEGGWRRCAECDEERLVTPGDFCPDCGSARLGLPFAVRFMLLALAACVILLESLAPLGPPGLNIHLITKAAILLPAIGLVFVSWKGRVERWVPHAAEVESLITSSELAVSVSFFTAGILLLWGGVTFLRLGA